MGKTLVAAMLVVACISGEARADPWDQYQADPNFELGARYWASQGSAQFSINSSKHDAALGNPTSTLNYDGMIGNSGEITWRARNETNTFAKGFVGAGALSGGNLDDRDFFAGQIKFSDTDSSIKGNDLIYGTIDVGQGFTLLDGARKVTVGPFIGFNYWQEEAEAFGARCNRDDVAAAFCGPPGSIAVPFSTKVITDQASWAALRLGAEMKVRLWNRLSLIGDAAALPVAYLLNEDSHRLRKDLGLGPNIEEQGLGWGYQLEGELRFDMTPAWSLGSGVRYWFAETNGSSKFVHENAESKLTEFQSERFGVFGDVTYRFSTF
jgi:hypothetical protein